MEVKNTLLLISLVLAIALAAAFGGILFYFSLQAEAMDQALLREERLLGNARVEKDREDGRLKVLKDQIEVQRTDAEGKPAGEGGLQHQVEIKRDDLKTQLGFLTGSRKEREDTLGKIKPADDTLMDSWHRLEVRIKKAQDAINEEYKGFGTRYDEKLAQLHEVRGELIREMSKGADPELLRMLDEAREIEDEIRKLEVKIKRLREEKLRRQTLEADGKIVHADEKTGTVTIDIGRAAGVRKGMLFDVFEIRRNGDRVRKAKIQVTKLEAEYSTAIVLAAQDPQPFCSNCGWQAYESYMHYCPYCTDGDDTNSDSIPDDARKLTPGARELMIVSPDPLNPLAEGDLVSNPFFERGRRYTFALGGTTAFRSRDEIRKFIEAHGSEFQDKLSLSTDVLVVGVGPDVENAVQEARKLGVKVIHERDLFTFWGGEESD